MRPAGEAWMVCPDGTRLASSIWAPEAGGPWPVLLMRQPYGRAIASTVTYAHPSWYARHGFLVVVQDVRGRGASEGMLRRLRPGGRPTGPPPFAGPAGLKVGTAGWAPMGSPIRGSPSC